MFSIVVPKILNVIGEGSKSRIGECHNPKTHLISDVLKLAFGNGEPFKVFRNDYDTKDGKVYINRSNYVQ